jgi:hypothetical protein
MFAKYPGAKKEFNKFNKFTEKFIANKAAYAKKAGEKYVIPVVFHIYGDVQHGKTVTYEKIKKAVEVINEDFNGLNDDFNSIDPTFNSRKATLDIRFALAKKDPTGGATTGVIFHPVTSGYGEDDVPDSRIAIDAWDNYKYMNVYIMGDLYGDDATTNSGVAWYPNTGMSDRNVARVVYNGQYLHGNTDKEFASVLTHEFGHWLNLIHTFEGGCADPNGDYVSDTPKEDENAGDKGCTPGASECGNLINYENYMGYDSTRGCAKMYTRGQVDRMLAALEHPARRPLWQQSNLAATGVDLNGATLSVSNRVVEENYQKNNGAIDNQNSEIQILDGSFAVSSGALTEGVHYTTSGIPQGCTVTIDALSNRRLRVKFSGQTSAHSVSNNTTGTITFKNAVISGGVSSLISDKVSYDFSFFDPYKIVHVPNVNHTVDAANVWKFFRIKDLEINAYGIFIDNGVLKFETYAKELVCQSGTLNITPLSKGTEISTQSSWVKGGAYPDLHVVRSPSYTNWDGVTAYIGFKTEVRLGKTSHGWFKIKVNSNGTSYTLLEYAYSTKPDGIIKAGSTSLGEPTPTCNDDIQNGDETGVDCGGSCTPCQTEPTCNDGIQNGDETGVDCGGSCTPCDTSTTYCNSNGKNVAGEYISRVQLGTIDNTSTGSTGGYGDYTSVSTTLSKGSSHTINITPIWTATSYAEGYSVWIDYNQDGDFADANEQVWSKAASQDAQVSGNFTVPSGAKNGNTRMRVSMKYNGIPTACESFNYGEVEDYTVNIGTGGGSNPTCTDGIQNGNETGVDCGGSCAPCSTGNGVVYVNMNDVTANSSSSWNFFRIEVGDDDGFGAWFANNSVQLVAYNKNVVCEGSSSNATLLGEGVQVGASSNFVTESSSYIVSSSSYNNWNGRSGYIGFAYKVNGNTHYGWFYATVANDGSSYTILDYAYNTNAGQGLTTKRPAAAGSVKLESLVKIYPNSFKERINIDLTKLGEDKFTIRVYDILGRLIHNEKYNKNPGVVSFGETITENGNYFVKITSKGTSEIHTIVKK